MHDYDEETAMVAREWEQRSGDEMAETTGRQLWVEDGTAGHTAAVPPGETVESLCADYAATYDAGDHCGPIEATWHLYLDGREVDSGAFRFTPA